MTTLRTAVAAAITLLAGTAPAAAATQLGDYFTLGGFGTLGGVKTDSDEGQFGRDRQTGGADKDADFEVDSNLGLQLTGNATKWLSGTVQMLAAKRDKDHIQAKIEWAYVLVKPLDGLTLRGGRMATPAFAISDSRNIGYANTWVRAPNEVYALNIFRNFEGADATYQLPLGPTTLSVTALGGDSSAKVNGNSVDGDKLRGLNVQLETEWATFRAGQLRVDVSVPALRAADDPYKFTGIGITVDRDNLVAQAEYVQRRSGKQGRIVDANGWYVMGGWRFGALLPYAIASRTAPDQAGSPFYISATQKTAALGLRWDAFSAAAIKFQVDHIETKDTKGISFTTPLRSSGIPGVPPTPSPVRGPVNVFSAVVDFTF